MKNMKATNGTRRMVTFVIADFSTADCGRDVGVVETTVTPSSWHGTAHSPGPMFAAVATSSIQDFRAHVNRLTNSQVNRLTYLD
jgi:hypothetical protein